MAIGETISIWFKAVWRAGRDLGPGTRIAA